MAIQRAIFSPPPGTILGETDYSIPGQWADSSNVRYVSGKLQPIGGWLQTSALTAITDGCVQMLEWYSKAGERYLAMAGTNVVKVLYGSSLGSIVDITPAGFATSANNRWTLDLWGDHLIACLSGGKVYEWDLNILNDLVAITNAPTVNTVTLTTDQRQVMLFGAKEFISGTFNPRCIRWSKTQDNTSWDPTVTLLTGEYVLDGSGGSIRAAKKIGTGIAVWTDDELFLGEYTGDTSNLWVFRRQAIGCGTLGESTATVADGVAYWISGDLRLMMWIPGQIPREIPGLPVYYLSNGATFAKNLMGKGIVWHNREFNEIWFHGVTTSTFPNTYISVNVNSINSDRPIWAPGALNRSCMYQGINGAYGWSWITGKIYTHESGKQGADLTDRLSWYASALVYLDKGQRSVMVQRHIGDFEAQVGNVTLTLSKLDWPQGAETTLQTKTLAVGDDKTDFRATGRLMRIKYSGSDGTSGITDTFVRLGSNTYEYVVAGNR